MSAITWAIQRLREPSTYAGLAGLLGAFGLADATSWAHDISMAVMGLSGVAAMLLKEAGSGK